MARKKREGDTPDKIKASTKLDFERAERLLDAHEIIAGDTKFGIETNRARCRVHRLLLRLEAQYREGSRRQMSIDDVAGRTRRKAAWEGEAAKLAIEFRAAWGFDVSFPFPTELSDAPEAPTVVIVDKGEAATLPKLPAEQKAKRVRGDAPIVVPVEPDPPAPVEDLITPPIGSATPQPGERWTTKDGAGSVHKILRYDDAGRLLTQPLNGFGGDLGKPQRFDAQAFIEEHVKGASAS